LIKVLCREIARLATCPMVADSHTRLARAEPNRIIKSTIMVKCRDQTSNGAVFIQM
jgi:hypothetical protein